MLSTRLNAVGLAIALAFGSASALADTTYTNSPDLGAWWHPLGGGGTQVYANSFVAPTTGSVVELGLWLQGGPSDLLFQIYGSLGNDPTSGPDQGNVLVSSNTIAAGSYSSLTYVSNTSFSSNNVLNVGETYWFAASSVFLGDQLGNYTVGASSGAGPGSFWYSNASDGVFFDGQNLTPQMAFQVTIGGDSNVAPVPEPETYAMMLAGLGLLGLAARRRKQQQAA